MNTQAPHHRAILQNIARRAMLERGLLPDFSSEVLEELNHLEKSEIAAGGPHGVSEVIRDLRNLAWASIDDDDSLDLDQLTTAEALPGGKIRILAAVADVDALVKDGSAIDGHARHNTTSVYTAAQIFPMLPEQLSTGLTSLNQDEDRLAMVIDMVVDANGELQESQIYRAQVRNHAKLAYESVAAWLDGKGPMPRSLAAVKGLDENLRLQDKAAQSLHQFRHSRGALSFETLQSRPVFDGDDIRDLEIQRRDRAREIIEEIMIAANSAAARFLEERNYPSIRRVVRNPKRWEKIVAIAREHGADLPEQPDARSLEAFLMNEKTEDPVRFPDLSLAVIKLLGAGEYAAEMPGMEGMGHFGLAVKDYSHTTAPNRRYSDLITHRSLKAALEGRPAPYSYAELEEMAQHFTRQEDAANKVERQVSKSAAALLLQSKIGQEFDAMVTGAAAKGTWARLLSYAVEGRVEEGYQGLDVGDRIRVELIGVDVELGHIDFRAVHPERRRSI